MTNFKEYGIIVFIAWLLYSSCCCRNRDCPDLRLGYITLEPLSWINGYQNRQVGTCPIPISGGDPCDFTGNDILIDETSTYSHDPDKYILWAEIVHCCHDYSTEISYQFYQAELGINAETFGITNSDKLLTRISMNISQSDCNPRIPVPIIENKTPNVRIYYREPCISISDNCESPPPNNSGDRYRPQYEDNIMAIYADDETEASVPVVLAHISSEQPCTQ